MKTPPTEVMVVIRRPSVCLLQTAGETDVNGLKGSAVCCCVDSFSRSCVASILLPSPPRAPPSASWNEGRIRSRHEKWPDCRCAQPFSDVRRGRDRCGDSCGARRGRSKESEGAGRHPICACQRERDYGRPVAEEQRCLGESRGGHSEGGVGIAVGAVSRPESLAVPASALWCEGRSSRGWHWFSEIGIVGAEAAFGRRYY